MKTVLRKKLDPSKQAVEDVIAAHGATREVSLLGNHFTVLKNVFDPTLAPSGLMGRHFAASPAILGKVVADVGAGTGIFSCLFAMAGAKRVIATDVSRNAVKNIRSNVVRHKLERKVDIRLGYGLEPLSQFDRIDVIYCDFPFTDWRMPRNELDRAFFDVELKGLKSVLTCFSRTEWMRHVDLFICVSSLSNVWEKLEPHLGGISRERVVTLEEPWIDLELWHLRQNLCG